MRFREHILAMHAHMSQQVSKRQYRTRYVLFARSMDRVFPSPVVLLSCPATSIASFEASLISLARPSGNNLEKTFGIKFGGKYSSIQHLFVLGRSKRKLLSMSRIVRSLPRSSSHDDHQARLYARQLFGVLIFSSLHLKLPVGLEDFNCVCSSRTCKAMTSRGGD